MVRDLLIRGMLVGLVAGLLVFAFGRLVGEPPVDRAIAFETAMDEAKAKDAAAHGMPAAPDEPELVSRPTQAGIGLFTGVMVYSVAFGGLFALVFAAMNGRTGTLGPRGLAAVLGLAGFVVLYAVPNLIYPANPPSVGEPDTIGRRTALYFTVLAVSVAAAVIASALRGRLSHRFGRWYAGVLAVAGYLVVMVVAAQVMPAVNEVPADFPATVLWQFRTASAGMQAVMWAVLGLGFGAAVQWSAPRRHPALAGLR